MEGASRKKLYELRKLWASISHGLRMEIEFPIVLH